MCYFSVIEAGRKINNIIMAKLIIKNNIKKAVDELDKEKAISSVAGDVSIELQKKIDQIIIEGIKRAKANNRRTLLGRDL